MRQLQPDLWETEVESPFPGLTTHAYLLIRDEGNVLFYNTSQQNDIRQMGELGGVAYHFLSHRDEVGESIIQIRDLYDASLGGHRDELDAFAKVGEPDTLFEQRELLLEDVEVIPTPGHTPGSVCFQVQSVTAKTYLFTGDTLYLNDQGWQPGMLSFSNREELFESLKLLQTLKPDWVLSSAFSGSSGYEEVGENWVEKVDSALEKLSV